MNPRKIWFYGAQVEVITFDKFLSIIPVRSTESDTYSHYVFAGANFDPILGIGQDISHSIRTHLTLSDGPLNAVLKQFLLTQAFIARQLPRSLMEMVEEAVVKHMEQMGQSKYLVRVGPRKWLVANPTDFQIIFNETGAALACLCPARTVVNIVERLTETERVILDWPRTSKLAYEPYTGMDSENRSEPTTGIDTGAQAPQRDANFKAAREAFDQAAEPWVKESIVLSYKAIAALKKHFYPEE